MAHEFGIPIGAGCFDKRKDKRGKTYYRVRFSLGKNPETGKYAYSRGISVYGSKATAREAAAELREELLTEINETTKKLTIAQYVDQWQKQRRASGVVKDKTCDKDEPILHRIKHYFGDIRPQDLDVVTIKSIYTQILSGQELTENQLSWMHKKFKQVLDECEADGFITHNPARNKTIKTPRQSGAKRRSLSKDEAIRLRHAEYASDEESRFMGIVIGLATGCRRGEVLGLQWKHVHLDEAYPYIRIEQQLIYKHIGYEPPKTKNAIRTISIDQDTAEMLRAWKETQAAFINELRKQGITTSQQNDETAVISNSEGEKCNTYNYARWFRSFVIRNGFGGYIDGEGNTVHEEYNEQGFPVDENGKPYSRSNRRPQIKKHYKGLKFHELRHTHITLQIGNGMDFKTVSKRAGHSKTSTTMDIYTHAIPANDHAAAELMGNLLRK